MSRGLRLLLRALRRTAPLVLVLAAGLALAAWLTAKAGDPALYPPPPGDDAVTVRLVANAWHSGLLLPARRWPGRPRRPGAAPSSG